MAAPYLLDLSHTGHTRARTGIQRVTRSLHAELGARGVAVTHDPYAGTWRTFEPWENANLAAVAPAAKRGAAWPLAARLRGRARRWLGRGPQALPSAAGLIVPELFSAAVGAALPALFQSVAGPRIALFHDAIALKFPELSPAKTVARFPPYLAELLRFDGVAAVSEDSRATLVDYWQWLGAKSAPPVVAIPLGIDAPPAPAGVSPAANEPEILCVGSIEGRKNHLALLEASESLWARGTRFSLRLIGLAQPQTGGAALQRLGELQAAGRPIRYDGPVGEAELERAYAACTFTVYPSLVEGFGLPVLESLARGKPCICSGRGALGESARGGGAVMLEHVGASDLAAAIDRLLGAPAELAALAATARARRFRSWADYTRDLTSWLDGLPRRD